MTETKYNQVSISTQLLTKLFSHITVRQLDYKSPCWLWHPHNHSQYGMVHWAKQYYLSHRLMYALFVEPVDPSFHIDHLCRVPTCVNPSHLELVTPKENYLRGVSPSAVNAKKTHCVNGHLLKGKNVWLHPDTLHRSCMACIKAWNRKKDAEIRQLPYDHPERVKQRQINKEQYQKFKALPYDHPDRVKQREYNRMHRQKNPNYQREYRARKKAEKEQSS